MKRPNNPQLYVIYILAREITKSTSNDLILIVVSAVKEKYRIIRLHVIRKT